MQRHPHFNLWLHSDNELAEILNRRVIERISLHEWPLSCVQLLQFEDGGCIIYKSQFEEGVEPEFYNSAVSPLLPGHKLLGSYQQTKALLIEYIHAPLLKDLELSETEKLSYGQQVLAGIAEIKWDVPVYQDFSTPERWQVYVDDTLQKLRALIETGRFHLTDRKIAMALAEWADSADVKKLMFSKPALLHADLGSDNIFVTFDGVRVIDWQYPRCGPAEVDFACYLDGVDIDPYKYARSSAVEVFYFMRLSWLVECKSRLFPQGESYDHQVSSLATRILDH